jgi:hypothetical protein
MHIINTFFAAAALFAFANRFVLFRLLPNDCLD